MGVQCATVVLMVRPAGEAMFRFNPQTGDNKFTRTEGEGFDAAVDAPDVLLPEERTELEPYLQKLETEMEKFKERLDKGEISPDAEEAEIQAVLDRIESQMSEAEIVRKDELLEKEAVLVHEKVMKESAGVEKMYKDAGIYVPVLENFDKRAFDAIYPNCVVPFEGEEEGDPDYITLHSMRAPNRRLEHSREFIYFFSQIAKYKIRKSFIPYEKDNRALEATASMVHSRQPFTDDDGKRYKGVFFSALSHRTDMGLLNEYAEKMNYKAVTFNTADRDGKPVYHSDVVMNIGDKFAVVCDEVIVPEDRERVISELKKTGREVITITLDQMESFAGNALAVQNEKGEKFLAMSTGAYKSLRPDQVERIEKYAKIIHAPTPYGEKYGGGSVRCLSQELFVRDVKAFIERLKRFSPTLTFPLDERIYTMGRAEDPAPSYAN